MGVALRDSLLHAPLIHAAALVGGQHQFQFHGASLDGCEGDGVGCAFQGAVATGVLHFHPLTGIVAVV